MAGRSRWTWTCARRRPAALIADWFAFFASNGVRIVRLDAVGYVVKKPGTSCFMVEPEIWEVIDWLIADGGRASGLVVLPEVHDAYATHEKLAARGYWTYDFVLPGLTLLAFETGEATRLAAHLARSPRAPVHDARLPRRHPGQPGPRRASSRPPRCARLADAVLARGGNINRILSDDPADGVDVHQLNCTYFSALGEDDERYLAARAIQLFARGIPQVYYVGLLAGANDQAAVERTGEGRAVNRHDYTAAGDRGRAPAPRGPATPRAGPSADHPPGVRRAPSRSPRPIRARSGCGGRMGPRRASWSWSWRRAG